jgi:AraC-like DNA-binding protein
MEWIFHIGIAQSIFSSFLLFTKRNNTLADRILAFWMIFIGLELWHMLLEIIQSPFHGFTSNFGFYSLTFGPFLYLYVSKLTLENSVFRIKDLIHFVPYCTFCFFHIAFFTNRPLLSGEMEMDSGWFILNMVRVIALFISLTVYSVLSLKGIKNHKKSIKDSFSFESSNITLNWLRQVTWIFIATYVVLIINMLTGNIAQTLLNTSHYIPAMGLTFFCFSLSYYGFNQPTLFQRSIFRNSEDQKTETTALSDGRRKDYLNRLEHCIRNDKPYLNPELTIKELADIVKLPRHYITEILKSELDKNFFTLVNDYRIEEVKRRLISDEFKNDSVLRLALDSGFNSKSSFNAIFKQYTGLTPSAYRKKH